MPAPNIHRSWTSRMVWFGESAILHSLSTAGEPGSTDISWFINQSNWISNYFQIKIFFQNIKSNSFFKQTEGNCILFHNNCELGLTEQKQRQQLRYRIKFIINEWIILLKERTNIWRKKRKNELMNIRITNE